MEKKKLNENDQKLLAFCYDKPQSINNIAKFLNISPASVSNKVKKLSEEKLIKVEDKGEGKKTMVRAIAGIKTKEHMLELLKEIKRRGGVTEEEFDFILPRKSWDKEYDKATAMFTLQLMDPKLVEKKIFITKEGEKFLKGNK